MDRNTSGWNAASAARAARLHFVTGRVVRAATQSRLSTLTCWAGVAGPKHYASSSSHFDSIAAAPTGGGPSVTLGGNTCGS